VKKSAWRGHWKGRKNGFGAGKRLSANQGCQMSCEKIARNVIFLKKILNAINCGKEQPKNMGYFCNFGKTTQSKP
jgi:hypothetical protein